MLSLIKADLKERLNKKRLVIVFSLFAVISLLTIVIARINSEFSTLKNGITTEPGYSTKTNPTQSPEKPDGFAKIVLPSEKRQDYEIFKIEGPDSKKNYHKAQHIVYFPKGQDLVVPSMLSDYTFFSFHYAHWSFQYYSLGGTPLAKAIYGEPTTAQTEKLDLSYYQAENGHWAIGRPREEKYEQYSIVTGMLFHASTKVELDQLVELVDEYLQVEDSQDYAFSVDVEIPKRKQVQANYTEPTGKYRFYLPGGYRLSEPEESQQDWPLSFAGPEGQNICLALKGGPSTGICGFSTSGCTCCNTGCKLVDIAFFADPGGNLRLNGVLDKGGGQGSIRFLYGENGFFHPWLYYYASYSSGMSGFPVESNYQNYQKEVLNLLYLIESLERTY